MTTSAIPTVPFVSDDYTLFDYIDETDDNDDNDDDSLVDINENGETGKMSSKVSRRSSRRVSKKLSSGRDTSGSSISSSEPECDHINVYDDGTKTICTECGQEINCDSISFDKEWKNRNNDSRKSQRCTQRKQESKDIIKDIDGMDIPSDVKVKANENFIKISDGKIFRGEKRKGIIYNCIFHAFDYFPEYEKRKDVTYLQKYFGLSRSVISKASVQYNLLAHQCKLINDKPSKIYVTPKNYIPTLIENIGGGDHEINEVIKLFELIGNKSRILSVSRPESYAAGLVYYYYIQKKQDTDINKFVKDSNSSLSPLTIKKNMEEIDKVLARVLQRA